MSTVLYQEGRLTLSMFAGGRVRGPCVQIDVDDAYVQLTRDEVRELYNALREYLSAVKVKVE